MKNFILIALYLSTLAIFVRYGMSDKANAAVNDEPAGFGKATNILDSSNMPGAIEIVPLPAPLNRMAKYQTDVAPVTEDDDGPGGPGGGPTPTRTRTRTPTSTSTTTYSPTPTPTATMTPTPTPTLNYEAGKLLVTLRQGATTGCLQQINSLWNVQTMEPAHGVSFEDPVLADVTGISREYLLTVPGTTNMLEMRADYKDEDSPAQPCVERAGLPTFAEMPTQTALEPSALAGWAGAGCGTLDPAQECSALLDSGSDLYCPATDLYFRDQHNLHNYGQLPAMGLIGVDIDAPEAWYLYKLAFPPGSSPPPVTVAVIDYGIDADHPEFTGRVFPGVNMIQPIYPPTDSGGHGTQVAGIIAAAMDNGFGIAGVYPGAKILPIKACGATGCGTSLHVANGILWAAGQNISGYPPAPSGADRAQVINLSLEFPDLDDVCNPGEPDEDSRSQLEAAVKYAHGRGVVLVAAAGNGRCYDSTPDDGLTSACCAVTYPAAFDDVLAVSALDPCGVRLNNPTSNSNYGSQVDLSAPGGLIPTTNKGSTVGGDYVTNFWGTSAAAPQVAGVAALVKAYLPCMSSGDIISLLEASAVDIGAPGRDDEFGFGRVNAYNALLGAVCPVSILEISHPATPLLTSHRGRAINDNGDIVGWAYAAGAPYGTWWRNVGTGAPLQTTSQRLFSGINNQHEMIGFDDDDANRQGYLYNLDTLGQQWMEAAIPVNSEVINTMPAAINDQGVVVGTVDVGVAGVVTGNQAFVYDADSMSEARLLGSEINAVIPFWANAQAAQDINTNGLLVGFALHENLGTTHAFIMDVNEYGPSDPHLLPGANSVRDLPVPAQFANYHRYARALNDFPSGGGLESMLIVGTIQEGDCDPTCISSHAVVWRWDASLNGGSGDFAMTILPPRNPTCQAYAGGFYDLNNRNQVIGHENCGADPIPVFWEQGSSGAWLQGYAINDLLAPETLWSIKLVEAINNVGQITGEGLLNGQSRAFLLTLPRGNWRP